MKKYKNIQILRVFACLGVFVTHLAPKMGISGLAATVANFGASGVYLFFVISGFLACKSTQGTQGNRGKYLLSYYIKRGFKILPLYYAVVIYNLLLHTFLLQDVTPDPGGLYWLRYFLLTNAYVPAPDNFWGNLSATWTISLFLVFYLCAPFFNLFFTWAERLGEIKKSGQRKGAQQNGRQHGAGGVYAALFLYLAALLLRHIWVAAGLSSYMMIFYYLHFFVLGMLAGKLAEYFPSKTAALAMLALGAGLWLVQWFSGIGVDDFISLSWIFAAILLISLPFDEKKRSPAGKAVALLDQYSYEIYLVHAVVLDGIELLQGKIVMPAAVVLLSAVGLTAAGAYFARLLIEKPAEKLGRRLVTALRI